MASVSTHVLDTARGRPAAGVPVQLAAARAGSWEVVASGITDVEGRLRDLAVGLRGGVYRLTFEVATYEENFFPEVTVTFRAEAGEHYHIPLLLSPYGYSTYRGS